MGGDKLNARAYADNFTEEELLKALTFTHIRGKKLYLTLNTLVKEKEFSLIYDYVKPLYEAGLDGIIIQDLGVWSYVREVFPGLPLHASTQMTITGAMGADLLKSAGAARIVPARELSLEEIKNIKEKTGLEIECFIHGAMCYCYSGQCLFSSILGGRSGNRGRCAQPCRLPYRVSEKETCVSSEEIYPLSLKDMCTIEYIPQLIEAGIDSFKIEGRMKKPEYAAGVTAIYRKYIDRYYNECNTDKRYYNDCYHNKCYSDAHDDSNHVTTSTSYHVDKSDMDMLRKLYIRSEVQSGYYNRYNGREMITISRGAYLGSDDELLKEISEKYLKEEKKIPVKISGSFEAGKAATLTIEAVDNPQESGLHADVTCSGITHTSYGEVVQEALKRPMTKDDILKQLTKTGNSHVIIADHDIIVGENVFIPVAQLNELRRDAIMAFENKVIEANGFKNIGKSMQQNLQNHHLDNNSSKEHQGLPELHVTVQTIEQLTVVCQYTCDRIYLDSDLYILNYDQISQCLNAHPGFAIYLSLPYIIREKDKVYFEKLRNLLADKTNGLNIKINGFLVRNLEAVSWILSLKTKYDIVTDCGLYCFNANAVEFLQRYADEFTLPWELNGKEQRQLIDGMGNTKLSLPIYGTIPMMLSANCVKKTTNSCNKNNLPKSMFLIDRYNAKFPVLCNCKHCYNIIYNSLPYSLHNEWKKICRLGLFALRLDFIFENETQVRQILDFYTGKSDIFPINEYTSGHYKRGVG